MDAGTALFLDTIGGLDEPGYARPSKLPGWSRKHVVAHVAANADAIGNLVRWAATGTETPMYVSADERASAIDRGAALPARALADWARASAAQLSDAMAGLSEAQWTHEVRTAQGRPVPATETAWLRAREVFVHAVDLGLGVRFADLPADFLTALRAEIAHRRGLARMPAEVVDAPAAEITAWLAGRPHSIPRAPELEPWL